MKPSDFQKTVQCRFESCLKKVVRHVVKDYQQGLKRRKDKEIPFCELPEIVVEKLVVWDEYDSRYTFFNVCGNDIRICDDELAERSDWKLSVHWAWFIGENREPLKLTTKPEPYTLDRTLRWIQRQVDPTLKMLETITAKTGIDYLKEIRKSTKLTEKHYKIIEQQTTSTEDVILEKEN